MLVALIALFVALGGGAYAAINLPPNSVGTKQLKKKAVTAAKLANSSVTSVQVKDRSLLASDFAAGQLPSGPAGPRGLTGPQGSKGDTGATGPAGPTAGYTSSEGTYPGLGSTLSTMTVSTPVSGKLFVQAYLWGDSIGCPIIPVCTSADGYWQIYVDGSPVSNGGLNLHAGLGGSAGLATPLYGVTGVLPAGTHTVSVMYGRSGGNSTQTAGSARMSAILLGG